MPAAVIWAVSAIGAEIGSATLIMYAAEIGTAIFTAAVVAGSMAYSASEARKAKAQAKDAYNAAQVDRLVNVNSAVSPRDLVLGRVRKGGTVFYKASTGAYQKDFYLAIALAGHEVDAIEEIYLNDQLVTLDGGGNVTTAPYNVPTTVTTSGFATGFIYTLPANYVPGSAWGYEAVVTVVGLTATTSVNSGVIIY